jgi:oxygen-independent coproporphyrinogen-3 oxidase
VKKLPSNNIDLLIEKYNQPVPRYTSYPTVPYWHELRGSDSWIEKFRKRFIQFNKTDGISLYIHLPFCESLCTYCACNKRITKNHQVEEEYIEAILKEWNFYRAVMGEDPLIRELHLGGGTPTFFSANNLEYLLEGILVNSRMHPQHAFSIEGHPNNTRRDQLETLYRMGFRRISYGVQDNDPIVQRAINRIQPLENVRKVTEDAREIGFTSVNYDLIYGLPFQTLESGRKTVEEIIDLHPDRIAFYSYAHVPWKMKAQRLFDENDLPPAELKMQIYLQGRKMFIDQGYQDIGMDHFALPADELNIASKQGTLHRNFMGYTALKSALLIGLGVSAISDIGEAYAQNHRELEKYYQVVKTNQFPVVKGYFLDDVDLAFKQYILDISCRGKTILQSIHKNILDEFTLPMLKQMEDDRLVTINGDEVMVCTTGKQFIRNICQTFDLKWHEEKQSEKEKKFSMSV